MIAANGARVISQLPRSLAPNTVYFIRRNGGIDLIVTDHLGTSTPFNLIGLLEPIIGKPNGIVELDENGEIPFKYLDSVETVSLGSNNW